MDRRFVLSGILAAGLGLAASSAATAQAARWVVLGHHTVKVLKADQDVVVVGGNQGYFTHLDIKVGRNAVHFYDVKVIYGNNEEDHLQVRRLVPAGGSTGPMELNRERYRQRVIKEIVLTYQSGKWFKGRAEVDILGKHG